MIINYWPDELYIELQDKQNTDIMIDNKGNVNIEVDGDYYGKAYYTVDTDVCELIGFIELWKEVYGGLNVTRI